MWKFAVPVVVVSIIGSFFFIGLGIGPKPLPSPLVGKPMPEFNLPLLNDPGRALTNADLEGGVSLLNVWGPWCRECRVEHPFLLELARSGRVPIFGLNLPEERPGREEERLEGLAWLAQLGDPYVATGFDVDGKAAVDWGVYGAPETFLIGPNGRVLHKRVAVMTPEVWRNEFEPLLAEVCGDGPCPLPAILRQGAR